MKNLLKKVVLTLAVASAMSVLPISSADASQSYSTAVFSTENARANFCQVNNCISTFEVPYRYTGPIRYYAVFAL